MCSYGTLNAMQRNETHFLNSAYDKNELFFCLQFVRIKRVTKESDELLIESFENSIYIFWN